MNSGPTEQIFLMLVPLEIFRQNRQFFSRLWQPKPQFPDEPKILIPKDHDLIKAGYQRPTWLALIFFFFSPKFIHRVIYAGLWPFSPMIPEPLLPWTFVLCLSSFLFVF